MDDTRASIENPEEQLLLSSSASQSDDIVPELQNLSVDDTLDALDIECQDFLEDWEHYWLQQSMEQGTLP